MNYAHAIRLCLEFNKLQQKDLVKRTKLSQTYLSQIMNNPEKEPSRATLSKIAKAMRVPFVSLLLLALSEDDKADVPAERHHIFDELLPTLHGMALSIIKRPKQK